MLDETGDSEADSTDNYHDEVYAFELMKWAHMVCLTTQVIILFLKSLKLAKGHSFVQMLDLMVNPITNLGSICYIMYLKGQDKHFWNDSTVYKDWLNIEVLVFFAWIAAGCLFLLLTYTFKLKSFWRKNKISKQRDIWQHKDTDDFLNYLKFEYKNFCMGASFLLVNIVFIFRIALDWHTEI